MIVRRIDEAPRKNGRPIGMAPDIKANGYGPRQDFPVTRPSFWHHAERHPVFGPRQQPPPVVDLVCLTCGRSVPSRTTHGEGEEARDLGHAVLAYGEGDAS